MIYLLYHDDVLYSVTFSTPFLSHRNRNSVRNRYPSEFVFDIILDCTDSSNGATDISNNTCDYYFNQGLYECGRLDDDDFSANEMCCACKG